MRYRSRQFEKWASVRVKGQLHYVVFVGVLGWGLMTGTLFALLTHLIAHQMDVSSLRSLELVSRLIISIGAFGIGGVFFGLAMWHFSEWQYRRAMRSANDVVRR